MFNEEFPENTDTVSNEDIMYWCFIGTIAGSLAALIFLTIIGN